MTRILVFCIAFLCASTGIAQKDSDIGIMAGGASYMGDVNVETPFRMIQPAGKVFYRKNFHTRLALRGNIMYARLAGDDAKASFEYQQLRNEQFSSDVLEASAFVEFNFFSFEKSPRHRYISPYLGGGLGFMLLDYSLAPKILDNLTIPFGFGVKVGINARLDIGIEYTLHRTFRDNLDQISNWRYNSSANYPLKQRANAQNDDWFSFFGIFLSYELKDCVTCPAYL